MAHEPACRQEWVMHEEWVMHDGTKCSRTTPMPLSGGKRPDVARGARAGAAVSYSMRRGREEVHRVPCPQLAGAAEGAPRLCTARPS